LSGRLPSAAEEAEREIGRTRADLAQTLAALERKLAARYLVKKGINMFNESFPGNQGLNRTLETIRANPVPVVLIGLGATWLIASNTGVAERIAQDERIEAARRRVADVASSIGTRAGEIGSGIAGRIGLGGEAARAGEAALGQTGNPIIDQPDQTGSDGWVHQVSGMAQEAWRSARDSGGAMLNRAGSYAGDGAGRIADQLTDAFGRHPLLLGAMAAMAGALVAALVPRTRIEDEWFGTARDEAWHKAREVGQEAVSRVRQAAEEAAVRVVDAAADSVKSELDKPLQG
jgi:uncharacterized protein DUF3618